MTPEFRNVYDDLARARAYDGLDFPGTYYLAYRDLPGIIGEHVRGRKALDFGCGTGRSTRFLRGFGFDALGVDTAAPMLARARERDPDGEYLLVPDGDLRALQIGNRTARSGEKVSIVMLDVEDRRPVEDVLCTDEDYRSLFQRSELTLLGTHRPLGRSTEPFPWVSETTIPPWAIYVLGCAGVD